MSAKRLLYLTHRWAGIALCLFFAMWFFTGVVMMYLPFPELRPEERFAGAESLDGTRVQLSTAAAYAKSGLSEPPQRVRMTTVLGRPAYHFLSRGEGWITVFADDGERLDAVTAAQAADAAARFRPGHHPEYIERTDMDQWTVSTSLRPFRPLHRVALGDAAGTELYVSDRTGEVVRDTSRLERVWNWLGANLHWLYPLELVRHRAVWHEVVVWLSIIGTLFALTGIATGLMRWRFPGRYRNGGSSPYRGWKRWHHVMGLGACAFLLTWIFSGLMSMNPWKLFPPKAPPSEEVARYRGGVLEPGAHARQLGGLLRGHPAPVKEVEWVRFAGRPYFVFYTAPGDSLLYPADQPEPGIQRFEQADLLANARNLRPDARIARTDWLVQHDNYWYSRENLGRVRVLPVLRVRFDDANATWYHIDPHTGQVLDRMTRSNRIQRWVYNGLHSFDFGFLLRNRPVWDVVVIALSLAGFVLSVSGAVIGWRRLSRRKAPRDAAQLGNSAAARL
ncbi:MAG: PepSY domain-containing protein [Betaproteobacteria bacterium]|nr:PepSY domain-containing protein [Betaproteobacteria bacterium]